MQPIGASESKKIDAMPHFVNSKFPAAPPGAPRAVLFDAYGTLFDVHSVAQLAEQLFAGHGTQLAALWREKQIDYTRITSMSSPHGEHYRSFWDLTRAGLRFAAQRLQLPLDAMAEDRLMNQYRHLGAFAESREVLHELKQRGIPAGILSNGDPEMLGAVVKSAGFSGLLAHVLSVHPLRKYKTDPAAYALGTQALAMPAREVLFVSGNAWDAIGATWFGYTTLWVNRAAAPPEQLEPQPSRTGSSLRDVLDFFD